MWTGGRRPGRVLSDSCAALARERQRVQEPAAVGLRAHARVHHDDLAAVLVAADQASEALAELQDRLGQRMVAERVTPFRAQRLETRLYERVARALERQPRDHEQRQRV